MGYLGDNINKILIVVKNCEMSHLQANKLPCQFHGYYQKTQDSWALLLMAIAVTKVSHFLALISWALVFNGVI